MGVSLTESVQYVVGLDPTLDSGASKPNQCLVFDMNFKATLVAGTATTFQISMADVSGNALLNGPISYVLEQASVGMVCNLKLPTGETVLSLPSQCSSIYLVATACNLDVLTTAGSPSLAYQSKITVSIMAVLNRQSGIYFNPKDFGSKVDLTLFKKISIQLTNLGPSSKFYLDFATVFGGGVLDPSSYAGNRQYTYTTFGATFSIIGAQASLLKSVADSSLSFWSSTNFFTGESDPVHTLNCPDGFYLTERFGCAACHPACGKCFGESYTECKTCNTGTFEPVPGSISSCRRIDSVPYGQFNTGVNCPANCDLCSGPGAQTCLACTSGSYLKQGFGTCGPCDTPGFYIASNDTCSKCHASCLTCTQAIVHNQLGLPNKYIALMKETQVVPRVQLAVYLLTLESAFPAISQALTSPQMVSARTVILLVPRVAAHSKPIVEAVAVTFIYSEIALVQNAPNRTASL